MPQATIYATRSAFVQYEYPNANDHSSTTVTAQNQYNDALLIGFGTAPSNVKFKKIEKCALNLYGTGKKDREYSDGENSYRFYARSLQAEFDENTVTYSDKPNGTYAQWYPSWLGKTGKAWHVGDNNVGGNLRLWYKCGVIVSQIATLDTAKSSNRPYMVVQYLDENVKAEPTDMAPASGYVPKKAANTFSWGLKLSGECLEEVKATATVFRWRAGSTGTINTINCGTAQKVTVKAGTFTASEIQWSVVVTLNTGETVTSSWITLTTVEATPSAKTISPSGIVIDATIVNRFSWQHIISTGTPQSKADVQWSADGETWNTLATVTGEKQYYDAPANTFASGTKYWRVRTYNTDGTASEWSDKAEFIAINAPTAPSITVQSTGARPRITWQTTEQEAYELTLSNGYATGTVYGTEKTWRAPAYLQDGSYTVRVRVQNKYGMWSEWGAAALPVSHTEGETITLTVSADQEAALLWQTAGSYDFYIVERDGGVIAKTTQKEYIDRTSVGETTYRVRGCYKNTDDYGLPAAQTVTVLPDTVMICDLESGTWQRLPLSETILRTSRAYRAASIATVHLSGLAYPVAEHTEFLDMTLQIACAFTRKNRTAALALEALVGRLVCAKTKQGDMVIGYMTALEKNADEIMSRYSFEITNLHRKETIDIDT